MMTLAKIAANALICGALGSVVPGVGFIAGAAIGALVGSIAALLYAGVA